MEKIKEIWRKSGSLEPRKYIYLIPAYWVLCMLYILWIDFQDFDIARILATVLLITMFYVDIRFYPFVRAWVSSARILRPFFGNAFGTYGIAGTIASTFIEAKNAYVDTDYDRHIYYNQFGEPVVKTDNRSKRDGFVGAIMMNLVLKPLMQLFFLNTMGMFGFIFGWIAVPLVERKEQKIKETHGEIING